MRAKDALGRYGEDVAVRHLQDAGFEIVARKCAEGEVDIIARDRGALVICEVKTRSSARYGVPAEAITRSKADRLRRLAAIWLREHPAGGVDIRFDVVCITQSGRGSASVEHLVGAF